VVSFGQQAFDQLSVFQKATIGPVPWMITTHADRPQVEVCELGQELSLKVGDGGIGWHIKALLTRRSSRRERDMPHDEG